MSYDDIRNTWWDEPEDEPEDESMNEFLAGFNALNTGKQDEFADSMKNDASGEYEFDKSELKAICDAIGICDGCQSVGMVNGYGYCEYCWEDLIE